MKTVFILNHVVCDEALLPDPPKENLVLNFQNRLSDDDDHVLPKHIDFQLFAVEKGIAYYTTRGVHVDRARDYQALRW